MQALLQFPFELMIQMQCIGVSSFGMPFTSEIRLFDVMFDRSGDRTLCHSVQEAVNFRLIE